MEPRFPRKKNWRARAPSPRHNFASYDELKDRCSWSRSPRPTPKRTRGRDVSPAARMQLSLPIGEISPHPCHIHAYTYSSTPAAGIGPLIYHISMPRQICDTPFCLRHIYRWGYVWIDVSSIFDGRDGWWLAAASNQPLPVHDTTHRPSAGDCQRGRATGGIDAFTTTGFSPCGGAIDAAGASIPASKGHELVRHEAGNRCVEAGGFEGNAPVQSESVQRRLACCAPDARNQGTHCPVCAIPPPTHPHIHTPSQPYKHVHVQ